MEKIECVIGGVELTRKEVEQFYQENIYIVSCRGVYQIDFVKGQDLYCGHLVINRKGIANRGRFYAMKAKEINNILEQKILIEE